jgi:hypothetical protein
MAGTRWRTFKKLLPLAAFAVAFAMTAMPAVAELDPGKLFVAKNAAAALTAAAKNSETTGQAPREADPNVKQLLEAVYDARDVMGGAAVPFNSLTSLSERMMTGVQVGLIYMLAGTGASDLQQIGADPQGAEKVNLNVIKFAPEMGRFFDFQLRIQGAVVDSVLAHLAAAKPEELARPNFQSGLGHIRAGSARTVAGMIETLAINGLSDEWRRERMPALTAMGPRLARFLQPDEKKELQDLAIACTELMTDPQVKRSLQAFAAAAGGG